MSKFNLIDEKWIPVRFPDGTRDELGICETLLRSKEIESIEDASPLVTAALHRFLLAVLYRALEGPTDIEQAKVLFKTGLPDDKIAAYLEKWRGRFWLFDKEHPFGQNPNVPEKSSGPWNRLTVENNPTKNKVLFDHTNMRNLGESGPRMCARLLVSIMSFSISGGRGYYPSPSSNAMMCIPCGRNLWQTLCHNLVPYSNREIVNADSALWEREPKKIPLANPKRVPVGHADLYTWQPRMILLEETGDGNISSVRFAAGEGADRSTERDPMQPYRVDEKAGILPVPFRRDRGIWRDFDSLLPDSEGYAPATIQNAVRLAGRDPAHLPRSIMVLGLRYQPPNADLDFWRMERYALPEALLGDGSIRTKVRQLLADAGDAQRSLWGACQSFARDTLSRGGRKPDNKDIAKFIAGVPVTAWYWSSLETQFQGILPQYSLEADPDDIRHRWLVNVRDTLRAAWGQHKSFSSTGNAWTIRALVKAEGVVARKLTELNDEIVKLESKEEAI